MTGWLFDAAGQHVPFLQRRDVFSRAGKTTPEAGHLAASSYFRRSSPPPSTRRTHAMRSARTSWLGLAALATGLSQVGTARAACCHFSAKHVDTLLPAHVRAGSTATTAAETRGPGGRGAEMAALSWLLR